MKKQQHRVQCHETARITEEATSHFWNGTESSSSFSTQITMKLDSFTDEASEVATTNHVTSSVTEKVPEVFQSPTSDTNEQAYGTSSNDSHPAEWVSSTNSQITETFFNSSDLEGESQTMASSLATTTDAWKEDGPKLDDVMNEDEVEKLRRKAREAYRNTEKLRQEIGKPAKRHWIWILFLLPAMALFIYGVFVALKRQAHHRRHSRSSEESSTLRKSTSAKWNMTFDKRSTPSSQGMFAREKFTNRGPLVLTKELKGDVKFLSSGGSVSEIDGIEFDDKLNEVVDIGTCVEVVPEDTHKNSHTSEQRDGSTTKRTQKDASTNKRTKSRTQVNSAKEDGKRKKRSLQRTQDQDESDVEKRKKRVERSTTPVCKTNTQKEKKSQ